MIERAKTKYLCLRDEWGYKSEWDKQYFLHDKGPKNQLKIKKGKR